MDEPQPITALEIIGYANRLNPLMLPAIVPPIFRVKTNPNRILLPAFVIHEGFVCNASERVETELARLSDAREVTLFEAPIPARRDFELWIDEHGAPQYEPIPNAAKKLGAISRHNIERAETALQEGQYEQAETFCRIALCADDRLIEPLAISAAIARRRNDAPGERTMAVLAKGRVTPFGFKLMVDGFSALVPKQPAVDLRDLLSYRPMHDIAQLKAAA